MCGIVKIRLLCSGKVHQEIGLREHEATQIQAKADISSSVECLITVWINSNTEKKYSEVSITFYPCIFSYLFILLGFWGWCLGWHNPQIAPGLPPVGLYTFNDIYITYQHIILCMWCIWAYLSVIMYIIIYSSFILNKSSSHSQSVWLTIFLFKSFLFSLFSL